MDKGSVPDGGENRSSRIRLTLLLSDRTDCGRMVVS